MRKEAEGSESLSRAVGVECHRKESVPFRDPATPEK